MNMVLKVLPWAILPLFFTLYWITAPSTVQSLDTGELMTNAFHFRVIHPPGYPLYTYLYGLFVNLSLPTTVFFRGSFLTILLSLGTLSLWLRYSTKKTLCALGLLVIGSSHLYWHYSILPDVFMLHLLIVVSFCLIYFADGPTEKNRYYAMLVVFSLGVCHHHTIVFLLPLMIHQYRKVLSRESTFVGLVAIISIAILYSSLMFLNQDSLTSWGNLNSLSDVLFHFLRKDYGTFKLASAGERIYFWEYLKIFSYSSVIDTFPFYLSLLIVIFQLRKNIFDNRDKLCFLCLFLYLVVFFGLSNVVPFRYGKEVVERFFIMPQILFAVLVIKILSLNWDRLKSIQRNIVIALFLACFALNLGTNFKNNDFSKNTVIEDFAINRLKSVHKPNTIVLEISDTHLFSLYYAHEVLGIRPDVKIVSHMLLFHPWYFEKVTKLIPQLKLNSIAMLDNKSYNLQTDFIDPNLDSFSFQLRKAQDKKQKYQLHYDLAGVLLSRGQGVTFNPPDLSSHRTPKEYLQDDPQFKIYKDIHYQYCYYYFQRFKHDYASKETKLSQAASTWLLEAVKVVPYCHHAWSLLCSLDIQKEKSCQEARKEYNQNYF